MKRGSAGNTDQQAFLCRRFSDRMTAPLGRLLRGELRPVTSVEWKEWQPLREIPFRKPWLQRRLQACHGGLIRTETSRFHLAFPYAPQQPFPLIPLFCFANVQTINGRQYAVFAFDGEEQPVFGEEKAVKK